LIFKNSDELDLMNQNNVYDFLKKEQPYAIINAAAKVGGIMANKTYPYQFLLNNMLIQNNLIKSAFDLQIEKFIFLGSSCIYPKYSKQPIKEEYLLSDSLEPTNEFYAIAKISGIKLIESLKKQYGSNYVSLMPTNLYGPKDNFDLNSSHVLPAMIRKFHDAKLKNSKNITLWGTGNPMREFLYVDDLAEAIIFSLENQMHEYLYNVGTGIDVKIIDLANKIKEVVGYNGNIVWNTEMPDGTPRKLMDSSKINNLGWKHKTDLNEGIIKTYKWFKENINELRVVKF
jgi:GDP-L-fucose synthase